MKKHLTVFALNLRIRAYRIIILAAASALLNFAAFLIFRPEISGFLMPGNTGRIFPLLFIAEQIAAALICMGDIKSKVNGALTMQRLLVSERAAFLWDCLVCTICFLFIWACEILTMYAVALFWKGHTDFFLGPQGLMMVFYESNFLHGLLPLAETRLLARNAVFLFAEGITAAFMTQAHRNKRKNAAGGLPLIAYLFAMVPTGIGEITFLLPLLLASGAGLTALIYGIINTHGGKMAEDTNI